MGLINTQFFVGTRCRLSRHKDSKFVNCWIQYFRGESLVVTCEDHLESEPGDSFYIEAYGPKAKACMEAVLKSVEGQGSVQDGAEGQPVPLMKLSLQLTGHLQVVDNAEVSRVMVENMFASFSFGGKEVRAQIRDVSVSGLGLITDSEIPKGTEVVLTIGTALGPVVAKGLVRHSRAYRGKFRVGVELSGLSRLDGSRWKKLLGEAA